MAKPFNVKAAFNAKMAATQKSWQYDRAKTMGGSEVFRCARWGFFKKRMPERAELPESVDDVNWGTAERGNVMEAWAVEQLREILGPEACRYMGDDQVTLIDPDFPLSATSDGLIVDVPRDFLAEYGVPDMGLDLNDVAKEIKTFDPRSGDLKTEARPRNIGQNIVQMGLYQRVTNHKPYFGLLTYFNPANLQDIRPFAVKYDEHVYKNAQRRAADVFDLTKSAKDFRPEGKHTNQCAHCEFTEVCYETEMEMYPELVIKLADIDPEQVAELEGLARTVAKARADQKAAKKANDDKSAELRFKMMELGTNKLGNMKKDGWYVNLSRRAGKMGIDKGMLKEDGLLEKYTVQGNDYFQMNVKANGVEVVDDAAVSDE